jgi:branched-chain amino acid transport system ATP-binding protein
MLQLSRLHAFYGKSHVLHGVDLQVAPGEIVALLGRNGSGRSTTAKAIMGLVDIQGSIAWKGQPLAGLKPRWSFEDMYAMFPRLRERQHTEAGVLSGGEQQMLTLCRSLMGDPELILIDEPTEGLAPRIVEQVAEYLLALKTRGLSVLLIEQKLTIALEISQRCVVMGHGRAMFEGTPAELRANAGVRKEWLEV